MLFSRSLGFLANANPFTFVKDANTYYIPREATIEKQWAAFSTTFFHPSLSLCTVYPYVYATI